MALDKELANTVLQQLEPISGLSAARKKELADLCFLETVNKDIDPLRMNVTHAAQYLYLIKGDLGLRLNDGSKVILRGGADAAKHAVNVNTRIVDTIALTQVEIIRIDTDLLDIMMTWDQLSGDKSGGTRDRKVSSKANAHSTLAKPTRSAVDWMNDTAVFSAFNLQSGVFSRLPPANIEEMFKRMTTFSASAGKVIIQQGVEGDYYYLIQSGVVEVSRIVDASQPPVLLAELEEGCAFGEEALVSDNKRNATVTMKTDGELLRLKKQDFVELLKAPLIHQVSMADATKEVESGAIWVDVRLPSEYKYDHIKDAINLPLNEIRQLSLALDKTKIYILYCQTGRRSSAAAFILTELSFQVIVLQGGTRGSVI